MKFTRERAFQICERRLRPDYRLSGGYSCYYNEMGKCELYVKECTGRGLCYAFKNDVAFTNVVREKIVKDPQWCMDNWDKLCNVDKDLFLAIYVGDD